MSVHYEAVLWNRQKKTYDRIMGLMILLYLIVFIGLNAFLHPDITPETLIIRATASLALVMLHFILLIGPLSRLNRKFLPLLYNRRHLGVTMFFVALIHGVFSIIQFHSGGDTIAIVSLFTANTHYFSLLHFPFQVLGFFALLILFLMAATSHDFWLHNLSPKLWKALHVLVYLAYALIVMHVMLGVVQLESSPILVSLLGLGMLSIISLHLIAAFRTIRIDRQQHRENKDGFVAVCEVNEIPENKAKIIALGGERIAVFKYENKLSAISNVCKHQNGPLGEGKIVDGCITCPWHGYQYQPHNGASPPPFKEKVATFEVKLLGTTVWIDPRPYPEGTERPPAIIQNNGHGTA